MNGEVSKQTAVGAGVCGVLLLICGVGCLAPSFILIANDEHDGDGTWSGIFLLIVGVLGVVTWWKRHKGVITGFLVVTIIVIIAIFIQSIMAGQRYSTYKERATWRCSRDSFHSCKCYEYFSSYARSSKDVYCNKSKMDTIISSLLAIVIFCVIGGIASFAGSIFGCMGACTIQSQPGTVVVRQPVVVTTTTLPGYSVQQPGYSVQQLGYSVQQPGYSAQLPGYSVQQPGYSVQQPGYSVQQPGSSVQQPGSSVQQPGYSVQQPGSSVQQPGSSIQQPGYSAQNHGYSAQLDGSQAPPSGYQASQSDYEALQPGYQAPQSDYQALQPGNQAPQSDYQAQDTVYEIPQLAVAAPQARSSQEQAPGEPPPEYTKHAL